MKVRFSISGVQFVVDHLIRYLDFLSYRFFSSSLNPMASTLRVGALRKFPFWHHFYSATFEQFFPHRANFIRLFDVCSGAIVSYGTLKSGKSHEKIKPWSIFLWFFSNFAFSLRQWRHVFFSNYMRKKIVKHLFAIKFAAGCGKSLASLFCNLWDWNDQRQFTDGKWDWIERR